MNTLLTTENVSEILNDRKIAQKDINHIKTIASSIFAKEPEKASLILSKHLLREYVTLDSAIEVIDSLKGNVDTLKRVYNSLLTEEEAAYEGLLADILIDDGVHPDQAFNIETEILRRISAPKNYGLLYKDIEANVRVILDSERKRTIKEVTTFTSKGQPNTNDILVIEAVLTDLVVYDNPIAQETRQFKSTWETKLRTHPIIIGPDVASEIAAQLSESGYILKKRDGEDIVKTSFAIFIENGKAEMKSEIDTPGFYFNQSGKKLQAIGYEVPAEVPCEDLAKGLQTLEEFADWFDSQKIQLATVFKWGLIAPFIFAIKQKGGSVEWLFLYGNAGTGKSTFGKMALYLWGVPHPDTNMVSGSGFDNEARIGDRLKQFTFPIVVDEPGALFEKRGASEMIKTAQENTTSRGKYIGKRYRTIPAFAPVCFTSNYKYPSSDASGEAFNRRFYPILFSRRERKPQNKQDEFNTKFNFKNRENSKLTDLAALGKYMAVEIMNNPKLLETHWQELTNTLVTSMYVEVGREPPEWILQWSEIETLVDLDEIHKESIRNFLVEEINKAFGTIQILDEEGRPQKQYDDKFDVKDSKDFANIVWSVLNHRKLPWALLGKNNMVYLTSGFLSALRKKECINESLPSLSDLLGWDYAKGDIKSAGFSGAHLRVHRSKFTEFVFPVCKDEGACE